MNESGEALRLLVKKFVPESFLVIYDDVDLPFGTIRFRTKGSAGTHRGMASCIELLGSSDFPRLRIGIRGNRGEKDLSKYVLENFTEEFSSFRIKFIRTHPICDIHRIFQGFGH